MAGAKDWEEGAVDLLLGVGARAPLFFLRSIQICQNTCFLRNFYCSTVRAQSQAAASPRLLALKQLSCLKVHVGMVAARSKGNGCFWGAGKVYKELETGLSTSIFV